MIGFTPMNVITLPNHFSHTDEWVVNSGEPIVLYARLLITDELGSRRYIPEAGSTVKIKFMRGRSFTLGGGGENQTFEISGTIEGSDRSILRFDVTAEQASKIYPGTVQVILKEGGVDKTLKKNYAVRVQTFGGGC